MSDVPYKSTSEVIWEDTGDVLFDSTTAPPTTVAPTTIAPTTEAPTTVAPTTIAPTTVIPTTIGPTTPLFGENFVWLDEPVDISIVDEDAWEDVDVSAYVPAGATIALLIWRHNHTSLADAVGWRAKGSTDDRSGTVRGRMFSCAVGLDSNRVFQVYCGGWGRVTLYLVGYAYECCDFFVDAETYTLAAPNAWEDFDLSALTGTDTAIGAFLELVVTSTAHQIGVRKNGSADSLLGYMYYKLGIACGTDGSEILECRASNTGAIFAVNAYAKDHAYFYTNWPDVTPVFNVAEWTDMAALPEGATGAFYRILAGGSNPTYGLRPKGSSGTLTGYAGYSASHFTSLFVRAGTGRVVQFYGSDLNTTVRLIGYTYDELPTTGPSTTETPTTEAPTVAPTTPVYPTTEAPTTFIVASTPPPSTVAPTTVAPSTVAPTTIAPTTVAPTSIAPTSLAPTSLAPTSLAPTTIVPTTVAPTTEAPTTTPPTTIVPTTIAPTTEAPTTIAPTTTPPTTIPPTTKPPTTTPPTTVAPTTLQPTTIKPTTVAPTTEGPTTIAPTTPGPLCEKEFDSLIADEIELESGITTEAVFDSTINEEITFNADLCW